MVRWTSDLALLASVKSLDAKRVRAALDQTFAFRKTHALPAMLLEPPATWAAPYTAMTAEDQLKWSTLADLTSAGQAFLDPVLAGELDSTWIPPSWTWQGRP